MIAAQFDTITGACGVGVVYDFEEVGSKFSNIWGEPYRRPTYQNKGGAGWVCAGFVENDAPSDTVFKEMCAKYTLVFRTPTRLNKNSGNPFYFAVFDTYGVNIPQGFDEVDD